MQRSSATQAIRFPLLLACAVLALACAPRETDEELRAVHVEGLQLDPRTDSPVLSLVEDGDGGRHLRLWIGEFEARSIAQALEREPIVRPNSHDLLKNVLERLDGRVRRILVTELRESTFYALIEVELQGRSLRIDARPSDAIAVALRTGAPVLVAESLFATSVEIPEDEGALEIDMRGALGDSREPPSL
jgi:bifunctional DNase/RNase